MLQIKDINWHKRKVVFSFNSLEQKRFVLSYRVRGQKINMDKENCPVG